MKITAVQEQSMKRRVYLSLNTCERKSHPHSRVAWRLHIWSSVKMGQETEDTSKFSICALE
jgi:hypothetical protein